MPKLIAEIIVNFILLLMLLLIVALCIAIFLVAVLGSIFVIGRLLFGDLDWSVFWVGLASAFCWTVIGTVYAESK